MAYLASPGEVRVRLTAVGPTGGGPGRDRPGRGQVRRSSARSSTAPTTRPWRRPSAACSASAASPWPPPSRSPARPRRPHHRGPRRLRLLPGRRGRLRHRRQGVLPASTADLLDADGPVSEPVAAAMAEGAPQGLRRRPGPGRHRRRRPHRAVRPPGRHLCLGVADAAGTATHHRPRRPHPGPPLDLLGRPRPGPPPPRGPARAGRPVPAGLGDPTVADPDLLTGRLFFAVPVPGAARSRWRRPCLGWRRCSAAPARPARRLAPPWPSSARSSRSWPTTWSGSARPPWPASRRPGCGWRAPAPSPRAARPGCCGPASAATPEVLVRLAAALAAACKAAGLRSEDRPLVPT